MEYIIATILGLVQGVTEFLPISSTGHLILVRSLLRISDTHALAFDAVLHLATAGAVVAYFRRDISALIQTFLRYVGRMPVGGRDAVLLFAILFGTIPAAIAGFFLEDMMDAALRAPLVTAFGLAGGSVLLGAAEYFCRKRSISSRGLTVYKGIGIGVFQMLALIPGMSRSGSSIAGGMLLGLSRADATRFAFLLAVPVIFGAGIKKVVEMLSLGGEVSWSAVLLGAFVAFLSGLAAIHFMIRYLRTHTFWPFIWYRLALALLVVLMVFAG